MSKTMAEVMEEHYIDITASNPDNLGRCICGGWVGSTMHISWDEHLAEALSDAGFGLVAEAGAKALEDAADSLEWVKPTTPPCADPEACCGSLESCDAMHRSSYVVGTAWLRSRAAFIRANDE